MAESPPWLPDLIGRFLQTSSPPYDLAGHYATYDPAALLLVGGQVLPKQRLTLTAYNQAWCMLLETLEDGQQATSFALVRVDAWAEDADGCSVVATVSGGGQEALQAAWRLSPDRLVLGSCLIDDAALPDPATLMARCLAELAHWGNHVEHPVWPLTGLALAYERLRAHDPLPLVSLPESRFTCENRGDCCRMGTWAIPVDANTAQALSAVDWPRLGVAAPEFGAPAAGPTAAGPTLRMQPNGDCHAHAGGGCSVHAVLGWQPIHACQIFPYQFTATPDSIVVTASFQCLTVGSNAGMPLAAQQTELQRRLQPIRHQLMVIPAEFPLYPEGPAITWNSYKSLETVLLDHLADRRLGDLPSRVRAISRGLAAVMRAAHGTALHFPETDWPATFEAAVASSPGAVTAEAAEVLMGRICDGSVWDQAERRPFNGWQAEAWALSGTEALGDRRDDELATRYLRTLLFRKLGLGIHGVAFVWGVVAWIACLWDRQTVYRGLHADLPMDRTLQLDTARKFDHSLLHTPLLAALSEDPGIRDALCDPETWLSLSAT